MPEAQQPKKLRVISFSALTDAEKCEWYFYLKKILKLPTKDDNVETYYGNLLHKYVQLVLQGILTPEQGAKKFIRTWNRFCKFYHKQIRKQYKKGNPNILHRNGVRVIMFISDAMKKQFGNYKVLYVEEKLEEKTEYEQKFIGYIDLVIETEEKIKYVIIDLKSCSNEFMFKKYMDTKKQYQISLYKMFYCVKYNVDPDLIDTYFVTMAKDPKIKQPLGFIRITSGPKKLMNAFNWMNSVLEKVKQGTFKKNYNTCDNFYGKPCPFKGTEHCDAK